MRYISLLLVFCTSIFWAQPAKTINDYQYAIIQAKYSWQKSPNQHNVNTLAKLHMEKYGFKTYLDTEILPSEITLASCDAVLVDVIDDSNMLNTKVTVRIRDCRNNVLFTSEEGTSREKDFKIAYRIALRNAFASLDQVDYKYGKGTEKQPNLTNAPKPVYSAVRLADGFRIMNGNLLVMRLHNTSNSNVFIATDEANAGVLQKTEGKWRFEYYKDSKFYSEEIDVKF